MRQEKKRGLGYAHETRVQLFRDDPECAAHLVTRVLGRQLPHYDQAVLHNADLGETQPVERRADVVIGLLDSAGIAEREDSGRTEMVLVVEVQTSYRRDKVFQWLEYAAVCAERHKCGVGLVVVCTDEPTAERYDREYDCGSLVLRPWVVGPQTLPAPRDEEEIAADPSLAVLAAAAHQDVPGMIETFLRGIRHLPDEEFAKVR
ncbi:hypothetical protein [Nocardiopsis coralliicola]